VVQFHGASIHLIVPEFADKEVVKYAKLRARRLKGLLPFIADDFDAFVVSPDDFPEAKLIVRNPRLPKRPPGAVTDADVEMFCDAEPTFVRKMDEKIAKVLTKKDEADRVDFRRRLLKWHLESSNYSDHLEQHFPPQWEDLEVLITTTGQSIETDAPLNAAAPEQRLTCTRKELATALKEKLPFMECDDREVVSWGTIARWLGECPLDF
jgi:hypothetical protein